MDWFSALRGSRTALVRTITGEPQPVPETPASPERRFRLFVQCLREVQGHSLVQAPASGRPIGDGMGLEELVGLIRPVFRTDAALIPWVAVRGAMTLLYQDCWRPGVDTPFVPMVEAIMGVGHTGDIANADPTIGISPDWDGRLTLDQREAVLGIYSAVWVRLLAYEEYSRMPITDLKATHLYAFPTVALDIIAWVAVAMCRLGNHHDLVADYPKPDLLGKPGWYTEPLFGKADRYWDGADWTSLCRNPQGREADVPL